MLLGHVGKADRICASIDDLRRMRCNYDCGPFLGQPVQFAENNLRIGRVECPSRFIRKNDGRLFDDEPCKRNALLFPTGERIDGLITSSAEPHSGECGIEVRELHRTSSIGSYSNFKILIDAGILDQCVVLEHVA